MLQRIELALPIQISLGASGVSLSPTVAAYGYWNAQFFHASAGYVRFALEVPRGASFGVYARRNALPTHTTYDLMEVVKGVAEDDSGRSRRATKVRRDRERQIQTLSYLCEHIDRLGNQGVRVSVFGFKSCVFLAVCGQIW